MRADMTDPMVPPTPAEAQLSEARHPAERNAALTLAAAQRDLAIAQASSPEQIAEYDDVTDPVPEYAAWLARMVEHERWARATAAQSVAAGRSAHIVADRGRCELPDVVAEAVDRARAAIAAMTGPDQAAATAARQEVLRRWSLDDEAALVALTADTAGPGIRGAVLVEQRPGGTGWVARCRFRDVHGVMCWLEQAGRSETAAAEALQDALAHRLASPTPPLRAHHAFERAARMWLSQVDAEAAAGIWTPTTADLYRQRLRSIVLPAIGSWRLDECTVQRLDGFLRGLVPMQSRETRKVIRTVVSSILRLAVLQDAIGDNPVRHLGPIEPDPGTSRGQR